MSVFMNFLIFSIAPSLNMVLTIGILKKKKKRNANHFLKWTVIGSQTQDTSKFLGNNGLFLCFSSFHRFLAVADLLWSREVFVECLSCAHQQAIYCLGQNEVTWLPCFYLVLYSVFSEWTFHRPGLTAASLFPCLLSDTPWGPVAAFVWFFIFLKTGQ